MDDTKTRNKTAIILVGGGMKSAHGAGFLHAMATHLGIADPDIIIGSSGDSANALYFCARQYDTMERVWTQLLSTPQFIALWRFWKIMDVDYLIDTVFKREAPLDVAALKKSAIHWAVPVTDFDTGKVLYASSGSGLDPFEILRASKAIPILFGKKVPLAHGRYIDGEFGPILQDHVDHAVSLGARNILIINHTKSWTRSSATPMRLYARITPDGMHDAIIRDMSTDVKSYKAPGAHVVFISPSNLPCSTATRSKEKLTATFERGVTDALALEDELRSLFSV